MNVTKYCRGIAVEHGHERLRKNYWERSLQRERSMLVERGTPEGWQRKGTAVQTIPARCDKDKEEFGETNMRGKREEAKAKDSAVHTRTSTTSSIR